MRIKVSEASWTPFSQALCQRTDVESAGLLLARVEETSSEVLLVADSLEVFPDDGYAIREIDRLELRGRVLNSMTQRARDEGLAIFTVHTHPGTSEPWFSFADDLGDRRLMPSFHVQAPGTPHGSIVIAAASGAVAARAFAEDGAVTALAFDVVGRRLQRHRQREVVDDDRFARQRLALGAAGQAAVGDLRVGVVGLGGTGSVVAMQLAHLGVRDLVFIDGDTVSRSNLSRVVGSVETDVDVTTKVDVAARLARSVDPTMNVTPVSSFMAVAEIELLRSCDVVFSCVDRHQPRAWMNQLAYDSRIPVIDMGSAFRVDPQSGRIKSSGGRVVVVGPGRPCLRCWGHLDPNALREEALPAEEREALKASGYLIGVDVDQPSVIAFNTMLAGAAVIEFLRLVTGFAGDDDPPNRLAFRFDEGEVSRSAVLPREGCRCRR